MAGGDRAAADVLEAFLVLEGGEVAGEEQREEVEVAEVEVAKGGRPASRRPPVETKADRGSSLVPPREALDDRADGGRPPLGLGAVRS